MFVSMPEFQFPVPAPLGIPGAFYARAMTWSSSAAWFVLTLRYPEAQGSQTCLLAWDTDVADVIASGGGQLESLLFVALKSAGKRRGWSTTQIAEVWEASDPDDEGGRRILMVSEDGQEYSGFFMELATGLQRKKLIARTRSARRGAKPDA